jgi:hypothetical protein
MLLKSFISLVLGLLIVVGVVHLGTPQSLRPEPMILLREARSTEGADDDERPSAGSRAAPGAPSANARVRVAGAGGAGVNLRREPGMAGRRLKGLFDGAEVDVIGSERRVDGLIWRNVRDPSDGSEGWVAAELLAPNGEERAPAP